jgi:hypothetical protein
MGGNMGLNRNYFEIHRLLNLTTELPLLKASKVGLIEAVEMDQRHISFEAPQKTCAKGQLVELEGVLHFHKDHQKFAATGRISDSLDLSDQLCLYTVELHRFDLNLWSDFRHAIEKTQHDVDQLFRSMRDFE